MDDRRPFAREARPDGLVFPLQLDPMGARGPTRNQASGSRWRQTSWGRYVPATTTKESIHQHILEQGARVCSHGAVTGWASLRFRGARYFDGVVGAPTDGFVPVPMVTGGALLRPDPRVSVCREQLAMDERELLDGIWVTTPERALFDEVRRHRSLRRAVADIEVAVAAGLLTFADFEAYVSGRNPWTGIGLARDAVALAGLGCWSRPEVAMALMWMLDADLSRPLCNVPVFDLAENLVAIVDLLDPEAGCVGEYQGADHKEGERHRNDVAREQGLREVGLECFEVVGGDLSDNDLVVKRMLAARRRSLFRGPADRLWTLEQPGWWPAWAAARGL